jgi:hypothetical protein
MFVRTAITEEKNNERSGYFGVQQVQAPKLYDNKEQKEAHRPHYSQEVLPFLQWSHRPQGNTVASRLGTAGQ